MMLRLLFLYMTLTLTFTATAVEVCEFELSPPATLFLRHITSAVQNGDLPPENLRWMIQQPTPVNPLIKDPRSIFNLSLNKALRREVHKLSAQDWKVIVERAKILDQNLKKHAARVNVASIATQPFYFWRKQSLELNALLMRGTHVTAKGEVFATLSDNSKIVIYDLIHQSEIIAFEDVQIPFYTYEWWTYFETAQGTPLLALTTDWKLTIVDLNKKSVVQEFDFRQLPLLKEAYEKWCQSARSAREYPLFNAQFFEKDGDLGVVVGYEGYQQANTPIVGPRVIPIGIFNLTKQWAREAYAPAGGFGFIKLPDNGIYIYGYANTSLKETPNLYVYNILTGEPGNSIQYKAKYSDFENSGVAPYLDAGGATHFIYHPIVEEKYYHFYDQKQRRFETVPNIRSIGQSTDVLFYDDPKKLSIASISESAAGYEIVVSEINGHAQTHPIQYGDQSGKFTSSETIIGPYGRLILIWEENEESGFLSGVHVYDVRSNQLLFLPLPSGSEFKNASPFYFSPIENKIQVFLKDRSEHATLFQLWGTP